MTSIAKALQMFDGRPDTGGVCIKLGDLRELVKENTELGARIAALRSQVEFVYDTLIEINPSNYDHDDVCRMNDASVEVMSALKETKTIKEREGEG